MILIYQSKYYHVIRVQTVTTQSNKSLFLQSCLHTSTVKPNTYTPQCLLCFTHTHDTNHLLTVTKYQHNIRSLVCGQSL